MPDPPGTQWLREQRQLLQDARNTVEMDKKIWHKNGEHQHDWDKYESAVDEFIKKKRLSKGDRFHVHHPGRKEPVIYEYLGPKSGGRKDWIRHGRKPRWS